MGSAPDIVVIALITRTPLLSTRERKCCVPVRGHAAVLKLPGSGFPILPLGNSDRVQVAEVVLAIGSPFGLGQTVTMGIVSAVGRANVGIAEYEDFIQTDAAINPGNSGGALINTRGELIGINTAILTESGGYMGVGFAIPINMARQVMDQLIRHGRVTRGFIGVTLQELTPALARGLRPSLARGALVADVTAGGPAARAGLMRGDVIVASDGKPVIDVGHLRNLIGTTPANARMRLRILRAGNERVIEIIVTEAPQRAPARTAPRVERGSLGISVADLTPEFARRLGLERGESGAVITKIVPGSQADEAGLRPGDLIQEVNRQPVRSASDFLRAAEQAKGKDLLLLVNRKGATA